MRNNDLKAAFVQRIGDRSGCWIWRGNTFKRGGYGAFTCRPHGIIMKRAHRVAWELFRGPIPDGAHVLHACDNRLCVNPNHLFLGDQKSNMRDMVQKARQAIGGSHSQAKLAEEDVLAIRADNRRQKEIAANYGISVPTVSQIRSRKTWRHI